MKLFHLISLLLCCVLLACKPESPTQTNISAAPFHDGEECHLCGMAITRFAGPKGQAFIGQQATVVKFCSTRDLISWYLQPENKPNTQAIYVHDMARSDWQHPDDRHLIDARNAWFVSGSQLRGAMGPTLASFATEQAAQQFAQQHEGNVLRFDELHLDNL